ncbi:MAG: LemA family protein [Patescibacteria group bacterium]
MKGNAILWIVLGVAVVILVYATSVYNGLVKANEGVDAQWAQVESQYQRRFDLIPNLVSSVQGAMSQEQAVFTALAEARAKYAGARTPDDRAAMASSVESSFARLLAIMENYPQLKSIDTVQSLIAELAGTENRVAVERMRFNEMVRDYNVSVKTFPRSMFAGMFGFAPRAMFEAVPGAEEVPQVEL